MKALLANQPVLNSASWFEFAKGTKPGTGSVVMDTGALNELIRITGQNPYVWLYIGDPEEKQEVKLQVVWTGAIPAVTNLDRSKGLYRVTIFDRRLVWWHKCRDDHYNVSTEDGALFNSNTINSLTGDPWTWEELVNELLLSLGVEEVELPYEPPDVPRNILCNYRPDPEVLEEVLNSIDCYMAYSPYDHKVSIYRKGTSDELEKAALETLAKAYRLEGMMNVVSNILHVVPASLVIMFPKLDLNAMYTGKEADRWYTITKAASSFLSSTPTLSGTQVRLSIPDVPARYNGSPPTLQNGALLEEIAQARAQSYYQAFADDSSRYSLSLVGVHNLNPNTEIDRVRWFFSGTGFYTQVESHTKKLWNPVQVARENPLALRIDPSSFGNQPIIGSSQNMVCKITSHDAGAIYVVQRCDRTGVNAWGQAFKARDILGREDLENGVIVLLVWDCYRGGSLPAFFTSGRRVYEVDSFCMIDSANPGTQYWGTTSMQCVRTASGSGGPDANGEQCLLFHFGTPITWDEDHSLAIAKGDMWVEWECQGGSTAYCNYYLDVIDEAFNCEFGDSPTWNTRPSWISGQLQYIQVYCDNIKAYPDSTILRAQDYAVGTNPSLTVWWPVIGDGEVIYGLQMRCSEWGRPPAGGTLLGAQFKIINVSATYDLLVGY